jgi:hypothetical protein
MTLKFVNVTGHDFVGGLAAYNHGTLTSCNSNGLVTGNDCVGGLAARNHYGTLTSCNSGGLVAGNDSVGGLIGENWGQAAHCYSACSTSGHSAVGGMIGRAVGNSYVTDSYATGPVEGYNNVAGFVGSISYCTIQRCFATGAVTGEAAFVGGLVGNSYYGTVQDCYAVGPVIGNAAVGGLVGYNLGLLVHSYSAGNVSGNISVGGLIGQNSEVSMGSVLMDCFWDTQTSNQTIGIGAGLQSDEAIGRITAAMKTLSTYAAQWDFAEVWRIAQDQTYPYLQIQLAADLNYDGSVNLSDLAIFAQHWLMGQ